MRSKYQRSSVRIGRGEHTRLAFESRSAIRTGEADIPKDLDCDVTSEFLVVRAIDFAHPAAAQECVDSVGAQAPTHE